MKPISEQYLNSSCEVKAVDNKPILIGRLSKILGEEILISGNGNKLPLIHCNTIVKVSIINTALGLKVLVGKVFLSTENFIRIAELQSMADFEKRNFFRVNVDLASRACLIPSGEKTAKIENPKYFPIHILDMSLSGLFFISGKSLTIGSCIAVTLNPYQAEIFLKCKILRKTAVNMNTENGYGCEYIGNSGKPYDLLCDLLCKYLFDCQRRQIRQIRESHPQ